MRTVILRFSYLVAGTFLLLSQGCATLPRNGGWGADATLPSGWDRIGEAAARAALEPRTWAPLAGALLLQTGDFDAKIADWAGDEAPLWGSAVRAGRGSDQLLTASQATYWASALAAPSGNDAKSWVSAKAKGVGVGMLAVGLNHETTELLKCATRRQRPDGSDHRSLPSGHASQASVYASLAGRNARSLPVGEAPRIAIEAAFSALAMGCAWSRVEAGKHYLSDALAGFALGHFLAAFVNDVFMGADAAQTVGLRVYSSDSHATVRLNVRFQ